VIDHFQQPAHDPNCPDRLDVLLDLSEETTIPKSRELQVVTGEITRVRERVQFEVCAIVAPGTRFTGCSVCLKLSQKRSFAKCWFSDPYQRLRRGWPPNARLASVNSGRHRVP